MGGFRQRHAAIGGCAVLGISGVFAPSCRDPDEMLVDFTTDVPCDQFDHLEVSVASLPHRAESDLQFGAPILRTERCTQTGATASLGRLVVARSASDRAAMLAVLAYKGATSARECVNGAPQDCIFARRRISFVDHTVLNLSVMMLAECQGVACDIVSTCRQGRTCVASDITCGADGECAEPSVPHVPDTPIPPRPDAAAFDASFVPDGALDASDASVIPNSGDAGDASSTGLPRAQCGSMLCAGVTHYCCARPSPPLLQCVATTPECTDVNQTRFECNYHSDCPSERPWCLWHPTDAGSGYGFTDCSPTYAGYQVTCRNDADCIGTGAGTACQRQSIGSSGKTIDHCSGNVATH